MIGYTVNNECKYSLLPFPHGQGMDGEAQVSLSLSTMSKCSNTTALLANPASTDLLHLLPAQIPTHIVFSVCCVICLGIPLSQDHVR